MAASQRTALFLRWDQLDEAVAYLTDLTHYAPNLPELYLLLGDCYVKMDQPENALRAYRQYRSLGGRAPRAVEQIQAL